MDDITEKENIATDDIHTKDDNDESIDKLMMEVTELKLQSQQFSVQRAKMKELFTQKEEEVLRLKDEKRRLESELDDTKCQVTVLGIEWESERTKNQQEINSLQELLSETLEENSKREEELQQMKARCDWLESELNHLRGELAERPLLAAPGAMLSTFAKKVVSQLGAQDPSSAAHENLEESMRKAKADAEVLKSLLVPLEEEITLLKDKLRDTDTQLRKYQQLVLNLKLDPSKVQGLLGDAGNAEPIMMVNNVNDHLDSARIDALPAGDSSFNDIGDILRQDVSTNKGCEMCSNYEAQLVQVEAKTRDLEKQLLTLDRYKEELAKETVFRKQMEEKWTEKKEQHKSEVSELQEKLKTVENHFRDLKDKYLKMCAKISEQFNTLSRERTETHERLDRLQLENENLVGKYNAHSSELQNEAINLPSAVEVLQEMWLKQREDLIKARVGQERSEETLKTWECMYFTTESKHQQLMQQLDTLKEQLAGKDASLEQSFAKVAELEERVVQINSDCEELKAKLSDSLEEKKRLENSEFELRNRLVSLQTGLENGEAVQKDFVKLSQDLQTQLEHLRVQNNVLRWEYEEDVTECRGCNQPFKSPKGKSNCRHCGRIFCQTCLSHRIISGPSSRESKVCDVCHTLLDHNTPPYFSTEPK